MSRITELEQKAQAFHQKLHQDTEKKLEEGMKPIFKDTKTILLKRLSIISESIEQGAESLKEQDNQATEEITTQILSNKESLKKQQSEATKEVSDLITKQAEQLQKRFTSALKEQSASLTAAQAAHQKQIESLRQSLQESSYLQEEIAAKVTLKKALITSIFPLILLIFILGTATIALGYFSTQGLKEYQQIKALKEVELKKLAESQKALTMSKKEMQEKYPQLSFMD